MMKKRILSLLLCCCLFIGLLPVLEFPVAAAGTGVVDKLDSLRPIYPHDQYWWRSQGANGGNHVTSNPCPHDPYTTYCGSYNGGWQCWAFASWIFNEVFQQAPNIWGGRNTDKSQVKEGDYVRFTYLDDARYGHSFVVLERKGNDVKVVENNADGSCRIRWDHWYDLTKPIVGWYWNGYANVKVNYYFDYYCRASNYDEVNGTPSQPVPGLPAQKPYPEEDFYAYIYNPNSNCNLENRNGNVQTASISTKDPRQIWHFYRLDQNLYKITNMYDGRCLEAINWGNTNGTNIQVHPDNGTTAQRWWFCGETAGNRYYVHPPYISDQSLVWDVEGGSTSPGANIQLYQNWYRENGGTFDENKMRSQTFQVNKINDISSVLAHNMGTNFYSRIAYNGTYLQTTGSDSGTSQDVCLTRTLKDDPHQIWYFERQSNGSYKITNAYNDWVLDVQGGQAQNRQKVQTWYNDNIGIRESKRWYCVYSPGDSTYRIVSALRYPNELYSLDIPYESTAEGTGVELFQQGFGDNQKFSIAAISYTKPSTKPAPPAIPQNFRYNADTLDKETSLTWDAVESTGPNDSRAYELYVYAGKASAGDPNPLIHEILTTTSYRSSIILPYGRNSLFVRAINQSLSSSDPNYASGYMTMSLSIGKPDLVLITVQATTGGTATRGGYYHVGLPAGVQATAEPGYHFVRWTEGGREVSTDAFYTFTVESSRTLTAVFEQVNTPPEDCDHNYVSTVTPSTCTEQGFTTYTCSKCGDSYKDRYTAALGHRYGEWIVTTPASAATDGIQERVCSNCGIKETSAIPATGSPLHGKIAISASDVSFPVDDGLLVVPNQNLTLRVTPDPGYRLASIQVMDANGKPIPLSGGGNTYTFKMPSCDVTVCPVFSKT